MTVRVLAYPLVIFGGTSLFFAIFCFSILSKLLMVFAFDVALTQLKS